MLNVFSALHCLFLFCLIHKCVTAVSPASANMSGINEDYVKEGETYHLVCETSMKPKGKILWVVNGQEMSTNNDSKVDENEVWHVTGSHDLVVEKQDVELPLFCRVNYDDGRFWAEKHYKTVSVYCKL